MWLEVVADHSVPSWTELVENLGGLIVWESQVGSLPNIGLVLAPDH